MPKRIQRRRTPNASGVHIHERRETADCPAGLTISRKHKLPEGEFQIDEWTWPDLTLWFVADDEFTEDERQIVYWALK